MDTSYEIINSFNPEEERLLRKYLTHRSKNAAESRKDLQLFELLCSKEKISSEQIIRKIYGNRKEKNKTVLNNAYRQLRLRLNEKIEDFILQQTPKEDGEMYIIKLVSIARYMYRKRRYELTWHYLEKAEEVGKNFEQYELLNRVYTIQMEYSWTRYAPVIENIIEKRNENLLLATKESDLNAALSLIHHRLIETRASGGSFEIDNIIEDILKKFNIGEEIKQKPLLIFKLIMIVSAGLYEKKDFKTLEKYLIKKYSEMENANMFDRYNHHHKIKLIGSIAMLNSKNRRYDLCEKYIDKLNLEKLKYNSQTFDNTFGLMISAELYLCTGRYKKTRQILEELEAIYESKLTINMEDMYYPYIKLSLAVIFMIEKNYSKSLQCINSTQRSEKFYIKGSGIKGAFKKHMLECIIHFEAGDHEYVNYRFKAQERRFKDFLSDTLNIRDKTFLMLFRRLNKNPDLLKDPDFITKVDQFITMETIEIGDNEFVSFNAWLKAKVEKRQYYDVFLEMVKSIEK